MNRRLALSRTRLVRFRPSDGENLGEADVINSRARSETRSCTSTSVERNEIRAKTANQKASGRASVLNETECNVNKAPQAVEMEAEWDVWVAPGQLTRWPAVWEDHRLIRECVLERSVSTRGSATLRGDPSHFLFHSTSTTHRRPEATERPWICSSHQKQPHSGAGSLTQSLKMTLN